MADLKISALPASTTPLAGTEVVPLVQSSTTKKVAVSDLTAGRAVSMLSATAGNIQVSGNTVASTNTDGNISVAPNGYGEVVIPNSADADAKLVLSGYGAGGDPYVRGYDRSGALNFNLVCDTDPNSRAFTFYGNVVIGTSGKGIDFSATPGTGTSELLADYEEGTFNATITSGAGSITSYSAPGTYVKVGKEITVQITISITNAGTASGLLNFSNLPFTSQNVTNYAYVGRTREDNVSGAVFDFLVAGNATTGLILSSVWASGQSYSLAGTYITA